MQTQNSIVNTCTVCIMGKKIFNGIENFLTFEKCEEH